MLMGDNCYIQLIKEAGSNNCFAASINKAYINAKSNNK